MNLLDPTAIAQPSAYTGRIKDCMCGRFRDMIGDLRQQSPGAGEHGHDEGPGASEPEERVVRPVKGFKLPTARQSQGGPLF